MSNALSSTSPRPLARVLRPGEITQEQIAEVLGKPLSEPEEQVNPGTIARSPGRMDVHYAPPGPQPFGSIAISSHRNGPELRFVTLAFGERSEGWTRGPGEVISDWACSPQGAAALLYSWLHRIDLIRLDFVLIIPPPDEPRWRAVRDRIWRATKPWRGVPDNRE